MHFWKDTEGREWSTALNVTTLKRVKALAGVDLMQAIQGDILERLNSDIVLLCDVLYAVHKDEADSRGISDEAFGRALAGDALEAATRALVEDLVDFFPNAATRRLLKKALEISAAETARAFATAEAALEAPPTATEPEAQSTAGGSSGNAPESAGSPPIPSPSAN